MPLLLADLHAPAEQLYCVTFGARWGHEKHPQGMHPQGFAVIEAHSVEAARAKAFQLWGPEWAFMYDHLDRQHPERFKESKYPFGILGYYVAEEPHG